MQDLESGGPTLEGFEMSPRSRRSDAEGVAGEECERGLKPLSLGESGEPPLENVQNLGAFSCSLAYSRYSSALFPGLLTQGFSDWHRLTDCSDQKAGVVAAWAVLMATPRAHAVPDWALEQAQVT